MALWTPANDTVKAWWDFADAATVTTVSGLVSNINDKSGNSLALSMGTSGNRPSYQSAVQNGNNVARFDGSNDSLRRESLNTGVLVNIPGATVFVVRQTSNIAATKYSFSISGSSTGTPRLLLGTGLTTNKSNASGRRADANLTENVFSTADDTTAFRIHSAIFDYENAVLSQYLDGTLDGQDSPFNTAGNSGLSTPARMAIGCSNSLTGFFQGDIGEVILVHRALSDADREIFEGYLAHKWGLASSLPAGHTYKTFAPEYPPAPMANGNATYSASVTASVVHGVVVDALATYTPDPFVVPEADAVAYYSPSCVAEALAANADGQFIATKFTATNISAKNARAATLLDIPTEFVLEIPKDVLHPDYQYSGFMGLNYQKLEAGQYSGGIMPYSVAGVTVLTSSPFTATHTASSLDIGTMKAENTPGEEVYDGVISISCATDAAWLLQTGPLEVVIPHTSRLTQASWLSSWNARSPDKYYAYYRLNETADSDVFIDNMAHGGYGEFFLETVFDSTVGTPTGASNNQFLGYLKKSAMGLPAASITDADIVFGVISQGLNARFVVNGFSVMNFTHLTSTDMRELYIEFQPASDPATWTVEQWNNMPMEVNFAYAVGRDSTFSYENSDSYTGVVNVQMYSAAFAVVNDADMTGIGGSASGTTDGYWSSSLTAASFWGGEAVEGSFYALPASTVNTNLVAYYTPEMVGIAAAPTVGSMEAPITVKVVTVLDYNESILIAPITVHVTSVPAQIEAPITVEVSKNTATLEAPITVEVYAPYSIEAPVVVGVFGDQVKWEANVFIGGVDYSARLTGVVRIEAEEGAARIASFTIIPVNGVINAFAFSGSSIVIEYVSNDSGTSVAQRIYTGLVDSVDYDPNQRLLSFTCTDNLQNKLAGMTREAIDSLTGGRISTAISGDDLPDNWEYAQECMRPVPASLDAGIYNELRVTNWHLSVVNKTHSEANVLDESLRVDLARRSDILNQINIQYQFRFSRLRERRKNIKWSINPYFWLKSNIPLLASETVQNAIDQTNWHADFVKYTPFPEVLLLDSAGNPKTDTSGDLAYVGRVIDPENTCMDVLAQLRLRFAQPVTEQYDIVVKSPQSIEKNGVIASDLSASKESTWEAADWENDYAAGPFMPSGAELEKVMDYHPDVTAAFNDEAMEILIDIAKVEILAASRKSSVEFDIVIDPNIDLTQRRKLDTYTVVAEGKVAQFVHELDFDNGTAVTTVRLVMSGHGSVGITPTETPTVAPDKPAIPETDTEDIGSPFFGGGEELGTYIGAKADSPAYSEDWQGWIVNVRKSIAVEGAGAAIPDARTKDLLNRNKDGSVIITKNQDEGYTGDLANPDYVEEKAYEEEGFRIILPEIEQDVRDATEVQVAAEYVVVIPEDEFTLSA